MRKAIITGAISVALAACGGNPRVPDPPAIGSHSQPACQSLIPASQGGPMPTGNIVALRWLGTSNYELSYRHQIIIMDTFYERPARTAALGFKVSDVRKADAILIGHAHSDHISDVGAVASQTGAPVVGSAITTAQAIALGVPKSRVVTVNGNEALRFGEVSVRPTHILHSTIEAGLIPALDALYKLDASPLTAEQKAQSAVVSARGSHDPKIVTEGTMGFTFTFPSGFTIVWFDSVGDPSTEELELARELAPVDVAIFPWTPHPISETQLAYTFQHLQLFRPGLYLPDHHDGIWGLWLDNGLAPLFMKIRDELPATQFVEPLYRSAICIDTSVPLRRRTVR